MDKESLALASPAPKLETRIPQVDGPAPHPTILVAAVDNDMRCELTREFQRCGYLVLDAGSAENALQIVIGHSRPIHVMLLQLDGRDEALAARLSQYRPAMEIVLVPRSSERARSAQRCPSDVLAKAHQVLGQIAISLQPAGTAGLSEVNQAGF
ncbi:MAG TPA: hypothetical protein VMJ75_27695 [Candidatus Acidoferrales bacterium]|nr:hypothetical protein [Candidatus Acidoferrales bacterium]